MRFSRPAAGVMFLAVLALTWTGCGSDKKSPTAPVATTPPATAVPSTARIELVVPSGIEPGESVQLTANAIRSDGSVENVSSRASWRVNHPAILEVSAAGLATGKTLGETSVTAVFAARGATAPMFVLPKDTFRIKGTIRESGFGIPDVKVTVIAGIGENLQSVSDGSGSYVLYGVRGPVRLQLKKEGYVNGIQQVEVTGHRQADFDMVAARPPADYTGTYTLTISAGEPCAINPGMAQLSAAARRREYTADVAQSGGALTITLSGAEFIVTHGFGNRFSGLIDPSGTLRARLAEAFFYYYYYERFDLVERFGTGALMIGGTVTATGSPQRLAGTLKGEILTSSRTSRPFLPASAGCSSNTHGFEMVRQSQGAR